jgi:hypothetical protein
MSVIVETPAKKFELLPKRDASGDGELLEISMVRSIPRLMACFAWTWCSTANAW